MLSTVCQDAKVENQDCLISEKLPRALHLFISDPHIFTLQTDRYNIHSQLEHRKFTNSQ